MSRPARLTLGNTLYWVLPLYDEDGILVDADTVPTIRVRKNGVASGESATIAKRSGATGLYDCEFNPADESKGDQFTIEEEATIGSQLYYNAFNFEVVGDTASEELLLIGSLGPDAVEVDHNFGGTDNLIYTTGSGDGIDNATIIAYLKTDYDAGNRGKSYHKAVSKTDVNGRWTRKMLLDPGTYTLYFYKQGCYGPDVQDITVT
jgi:hypothetical protein